MCIIDNCSVPARFSYPDLTDATHCYKHIFQGMKPSIKYNLGPHRSSKTSRCEYPECNRAAKYAPFGMISVMFCQFHKTDSMVCTRLGRCFNKTCIEPPCFALKGFPKIPFVCQTHSTKSMIPIPSIQCMHIGCNVLFPNFNHVDTQKGLYCKTHRIDGMVDITRPQCIDTDCTEVGRAKYDRYCFDCYMKTHSYNAKTARYRPKEFAVRDYILVNFPLKWVTNSAIRRGASRFRPDLRLDLLDRTIIIETDEFQHVRYSNNTEDQRITTIASDLSKPYLIVIRINPDGYRTSDGIDRPSPWTNQTIDANHLADWEQRLERLKREVSHWIDADNIPTKHIEYIRLFFS